MTWPTTSGRAENIPSSVDEVWLGGDGPRRLGRYLFEPATGELSSPEGAVRLRPQISRLLNALSAQPERLFTRKMLHEIMWPNTRVEYDAGLNNCILELRKAIAQDPDVFLETIPRRGYRLHVPKPPPSIGESGDVDSVQEDDPRRPNEVVADPTGRSGMRWVRTRPTMWATLALAGLVLTLGLFAGGEDGSDWVDLIVLRVDSGERIEDLESQFARVVRESSSYRTSPTLEASLTAVLKRDPSPSLQVIGWIDDEAESITMQILEPESGRSLTATRLAADEVGEGAPVDGAMEWLAISLPELSRTRDVDPYRAPRPDAKSAYRSATSFLNDGLFEESVPIFLRALRADASSGAIGRDLLVALTRSVQIRQPGDQMRARYTQLVEYARMVASATPHHPRANLLLAGDAVYRQHDLIAGRAYVMTAVGSASLDRPDDLVDAARILTVLGDTELASELLLQAERSSELPLGVMKGLAAGYLRLGMWVPAKDLCQRLTQGRIDLPWAQVCLVRSALHYGDEALASDIARTLMVRQGVEGIEDVVDPLTEFWEWTTARLLPTKALCPDALEVGVLGVHASAGRLEEFESTVEDSTVLIDPGMAPAIRASATYDAYRDSPNFRRRSRDLDHSYEVLARAVDRVPKVTFDLESRPSW